LFKINLLTKEFLYDLVKEDFLNIINSEEIDSAAITEIEE